MADNETIATYDQRAAEYAALTNDELREDRRLNAFIGHIPHGGHVLDLGCGPGASAAVMAAAGLQVTATDASGEMIALAAKHDGVTALVQSFDDISGTAIYDGVWANFSLLHAPRSQFADILSRLHSAMKPGGVFHIGLKLGTGEARDSIGRLYTYFTEAELGDYLRDAGFTPEHTSRGSSKGLDGVMADWICILSRA